MLDMVQGTVRPYPSKTGSLESHWINGADWWGERWIFGRVTKLIYSPNAPSMDYGMHEMRNGHIQGEMAW